MNNKSRVELTKSQLGNKTLSCKSIKANRLLCIFIIYLSNVLFLVDRADPFFTTTAVHFNSLMARYGAPLIVLNLVKVSLYWKLMNANRTSCLWWHAIYRYKHHGWDLNLLPLVWQTDGRQNVKSLHQECLHYTISWLLILKVVG